MEPVYNQNYYDNYDIGIGKVSYRTSENTKGFLEHVADELAKLGAKTVLDVGCAMGHLVARLRDLGVDAYGIDLSQYAISQVREDVRPYCAAQSVLCSLPERFPPKFDLVVSIEMFEHLPEEDAAAAVRQVCSWSDMVIFSSTPDDFDDPTHLNVRQREYWSGLFAGQGFYDDLDVRPLYITSYAVCYRRRADILPQIETYERFIRLSEAAHQRQLAQAGKRPFPSTVYYGDQEHGLSEERAITAEGEKEEGFLHFCASLPQGVTKLRFDPMESPCIVEDLHVYSNIGPLRAEPENAVEYRGKYVFLDRDPKFEIALDGKEVSSLDIRAHVTSLDYPEQEELLQTLFQYREQADQERRQLQEQISAQLSQHQAALQEQAEAHQAALAGQKQAYQTELQQKAVEYQAALQEKETAYQKALQEKEKEYQAELRHEKASFQQQKLALQDALGQKISQYRVALDQRAELQASLDHYMTHYHAAINQREDLKRQLTEAQNAYHVISNAFFWKITKPARVLADLIKKPFRKSRTFRLIGKGLRCFKENGFRYTWRKVQDKLRHRQDYRALSGKALFTPEELEAQRRHVFPQKITFSIVVPLYNTPENFLHEMIQSVIDQTYGDWELCMADGSDGEHRSVEKICGGYVRKDPRIKYRKLEQNLGISGNTNA